MMSVKATQAYGHLYPPKYDRPWLRFITDGGEGLGSGEPEPKGEGEDSKPSDEVTDWKAEARKWEARSKENKTAADELQALKDAEKTEIERAQSAAEAAQRELAATKAEAARLRIAAKHGIGEDHLDLLTGADDEQLEANAVKLAALIKPATEGPNPKKGAWAPFDPDEGKSPSSKTEPASPGMGTLRVAYAQAESKGDS